MPETDYIVDLMAVGDCVVLKCNGHEIDRQQCRDHEEAKRVAGSLAAWAKKRVAELRPK